MTRSPPPAGTDPAVVVSTTVDDPLAAARIGRILVEERLAACVQQIPGVVSIYRWQGRVDETAEYLLQIKTVRSRLGALLARLRALHPYDTPEILAVPVVAGDESYLAWMTENTTDQPPQGG